MPKLKIRDFFEEFSNNQRDLGLNNSYLFSLVYSNRFFNKVACCSRVIRQKMAICLQLRPTKNALIAIFAEAIFGLNAALHFPLLLSWLLIIDSAMSYSTVLLHIQVLFTFQRFNYSVYCTSILSIQVYSVMYLTHKWR